MQRSTFHTLTAIMAFWFSTTTWSAEDTTLQLLYMERDGVGAILQYLQKNSANKFVAISKHPDEIKPAILALRDEGRAPDAVIVPADHLGLHEFLQYSSVDPALFNSTIAQHIWDSVTSDGKISGVPLIQGNHLVLYYNKALVSQVATSWQELLAQKPRFDRMGLQTIAWSADEPFWFLPLLNAFGGWPLHNGQATLNTPAMIETLRFYKTLFHQGLAQSGCLYQCSSANFIDEKAAYLIGGEWDSKMFHRLLGEKLGVSPLPSAAGHKVYPTFTTHAMAFPSDGLHGSKRAALIALVNDLLSPATQRHWWESQGAIPVETSAFTHAGQHAKGYAKNIIAFMEGARALPADQTMSFTWHAIDKGLLLHRDGSLEAAATAAHMQVLLERHLRDAQRELTKQRQMRRSERKN